MSGVFELLLDSEAASLGELPDHFGGGCDERGLAE
jgi:hypothetical protein